MKIGNVYDTNNVNNILGIGIYPITFIGMGDWIPKTLLFPLRESNSFFFKFFFVGEYYFEKGMGETERSMYSQGRYSQVLPTDKNRARRDDGMFAF